MLRKTSDWRRWWLAPKPPIAPGETDITHIDMGQEPASETTELKLLLSVRDRLHLAEVMRTLKRSSAVLRVARVKP